MIVDFFKVSSIFRNFKQRTEIKIDNRGTFLSLEVVGHEQVAFILLQIRVKEIVGVVESNSETPMVFESEPYSSSC